VDPHLGDAPIFREITAMAPKQNEDIDLHQGQLPAECLGCDPPHPGGGKMANIVDLARILADVASRTRDPGTAQELMILVNRLFTEAGLPAGEPEPPVRH
jgi:hypothetical protein